MGNVSGCCSSETVVKNELDYTPPGLKLNPEQWLTNMLASEPDDLTN